MINVGFNCMLVGFMGDVGEFCEGNCLMIVFLSYYFMGGVVGYYFNSFLMIFMGFGCIFNFFFVFLVFSEGGVLS